MASLVLPVFPLNVVAFPGHRLPLRIFEPRYLQMLTDIRAHPEFVVALIRSGVEVGGEAMPYPVATLVDFAEVHGEGAVKRIDPMGRRRVYLEKIMRGDKPYLLAECSEYGDEAWTDADKEKNTTLERTLLSAAAQHAPGTEDGVADVIAEAKQDLSEENFSLFLCGCLALPAPFRQRFLEMKQAASRVDQALHLLRQAEQKSGAAGEGQQE